MIRDIWKRSMRWTQGWYKMLRYNLPSFQKSHWQEELAKYDWNASCPFGYDWGDPENPNDRWGNYLQLKERLLAQVTPRSTVLEIGSLGGKWTQYVLHARRIICVDINELGFAYIKKKFPQDNITFYLTRGDELTGIADNSVDLIFSFDTLVRVPKSYIARYFKEMSRVLTSGGRIYIHLPCLEKEVSRAKGFTRLTMAEIQKYCAINQFEQVVIDNDIIIHGVIVEAHKASPNPQ